MPKAENVGLSRDFAHSVGCELGDDEQLLKCLQGVNSSAFQQSAPQGSLFPMVDGLQFERWPADLFAHGLFADVPVIIGSTALENARDACGPWGVCGSATAEAVNASEFEQAGKFHAGFRRHRPFGSVQKLLGGPQRAATFPPPRSR